MVSDADVDVLANEHRDNTALSSHIWWIEVEMLRDVWSDGTSVFLNLLFIINVWVVGLGNLEKLIGEMKLIMVVIVRPLDLINVRLVNLLGVSGSELDDN